MRIKTVVKFINNYFEDVVLILLSIFIIRLLYQNYYLSNPQATKQAIKGTDCYDINFENESNPFVPVYDNETFRSDSIYFLETSCKGGLSSRQACCVESAARSNPERHVYVLFFGSATEPFIKSATLQRLLRFQNVRIIKIDATKYVKGTPVESLLARKDLRETKYTVAHNADILRLLVLYKHGGIYLDTDVIVTKPLNIQGNWLVKETINQTGNGILSFSRDEVGKNFTATGLGLLDATYDAHKWEYNGPLLMCRILSQKCGTGDVTKMNETTCPGIAVYEPKMFYPYPWMEWTKYFEPHDGKRSLYEPYTYHFNDNLSKNTKITKDSLLAKLAKTFCPDVYYLNQLDFGN